MGEMTRNRAIEILGVGANYASLWEIEEAVDMAIEALREQRPHGEWVPVSKRLPEEKINPITNDFEDVLCTTIWGDVRHYRYGKPIKHDKAHFWYGLEIMDKDVIAWMPLPEPYKKEGEAE